MTLRTLAALALPFALVPLAGCGGGKKFSPVSGKVTFQSKPATGALVVFHPKGDNTPQAVRPYGTVGADGSYTLASNAVDTGAPPGEYEVAITWAAPPKDAAKGMGGGEEKLGSDLLGGRFANPTKSGLRATVGTGPTEVPPFDLK
jgi:hypothetical protein